jgi:hypothetical protein
VKIDPRKRIFVGDPESEYRTSVDEKGKRFLIERFGNAKCGLTYGDRSSYRSLIPSLHRQALRKARSVVLLLGIGETRAHAGSEERHCAFRSSSRSLEDFLVVCLTAGAAPYSLPGPASLGVLQHPKSQSSLGLDPIQKSVQKAFASLR